MEIEGQTRFRRRDKPSVKQVYALAAALCVRMGEEFPASRAAASDLIQRLWDENGDPRTRVSAPHSREEVSAERLR